MSNNFQNQWDDDDDFEFDDEDTVQQPAPRGNDLVKQLRKQLRQMEKRDKEREQELQNLRDQQRSQTVSQILEAEGVNPKISKFIPAHITDADAVKGWLSENAEVFGFNTAPTNSGQKAPDEDVFQRMNDFTSDALSPNQFEDIYAKIDAAQSEEEVLALLEQLG